MSFDVSFSSVTFLIEIYYYTYLLVILYSVKNQSFDTVGKQLYFQVGEKLKEGPS